MADIKIAVADLLQRLDAQRPVAVKIDAERNKKHLADMKACARERRRVLREMAGWSDDKLARARRYDMRDALPDTPACPVSVVSQLEREISAWHYDSRRTVTLKPRDSAYQMLILEAYTLNNTVCKED